jgi:hypothetical protein
MHYYLLHNCGFVGFLSKSGEVRLAAACAGGALALAALLLANLFFLLRWLARRVSRAPA